MENAEEALVKEVGRAIAESESIDGVVAALGLLQFAAVSPAAPPVSSWRHIPDPSKFEHIAKLAEACKQGAQVQGSLLYRADLFGVISKLLLYKVAVDWLACFTQAEKELYFDSFFLMARQSEVVLALVPALIEDSNAELDASTGCMQAERLLVKCLLESLGVKRMVGELGEQQRDSSRQVAQILSSIPDRARPKAPAELHSSLFYGSVVSQLISAASERWQPSINILNDRPFIFIGEVFCKLCRRGHADVAAEEIVPALVEFSRTFRYSTNDESQVSTYWQAIVLSMRDLHALERFSEAILLAFLHHEVSDEDAYYNMSSLFPLSQIRTLFTERFLLWRVFPLRVLKWILDFAVLCKPLASGGTFQIKNVQADVLKSMAETWSEKTYIQSASVHQQTYLTAALGMCAKAMTKEEFESLTKYILKGVSARLDSPFEEIRRMAKQMALVCSVVINPANPLLLDDEDTVEELSNWDISGSLESRREKKEVKHSKLRDESIVIEDPDAVVDITNPGLTLKDESISGSDEDEETLKPYDMSEDESDLEKAKFPTQLSACANNLRKGDDPDTVERALEVCERLIRLKPDELEVSAADLAHALVYVRCSSISVEGEELAAETKRYCALVALLVCAPLPTVSILTKELYSVHVDVSQRLLILDVLSDGAKELANGEQNEAFDVIRRTPGPWKEVYHPFPGNSLITCGQTYERELPPKIGGRDLGKTRRWGNRSKEIREAGIRSTRKNNFGPVAAAFMLPVMRDFDKQMKELDILGTDFVVLGRLIQMLGICMESLVFQPDAASMGTLLLDMLQSGRICRHPEAYVRRSVLYAISRVLVSLHPSHLSSMGPSLADGLEWIREYSLNVASNDRDPECAKLAVACLHIHSEVALQAYRSSDSSKPTGSISPLIVPL